MKLGLFCNEAQPELCRRPTCSKKRLKYHRTYFCLAVRQHLLGRTFSVKIRTVFHFVTQTLQQYCILTISCTVLGGDTANLTAFPLITALDWRVVPPVISPGWMVSAAPRPAPSQSAVYLRVSGTKLVASRGSSRAELPNFRL